MSTPGRIPVVLLMHDTAMLYESAIAAEVFGVDRSDLSPSGLWFDFVIGTADGRPHSWFPTLPTVELGDLPTPGILIVPSTSDPDAAPDEAVITAVQHAHRQGAVVASLCTGAFILAAAGLLDGAAAATHWLHAADLARRHPEVDVRADVLHVDAGTVLTSAGKTAALDLCLHLVERELGAAVAGGLARRLVVPPHRSGGQAQFIPAPVSPRQPEALGATLEWARHRLDQPLTVEDLARRAGMSSRHLARRMQTEVQSTPLTWLRRARLARAQELLEGSDATMEQVAARCGLGSAATLRRHFRATLGVSPTTYRATFRG